MTQHHIRERSFFISWGWRNLRGGHELKLGPVGGQNIICPLLGGHKMSDFSWGWGNRLLLCKMLLASGGLPPRPSNIYICYIYGCHFIFSLYYLL